MLPIIQVTIVICVEHIESNIYVRGHKLLKNNNLNMCLF
jgi:hypothetical protein